MLMHYRLLRLHVEGMGPVTVATDAHGNSVYANAQAQARERMPENLAAVDAQRGGGSQAG